MNCSLRVTRYPSNSLSIIRVVLAWLEAPPGCDRPPEMHFAIALYNAARNDPYKDAHLPRYTPLAKVDDRRFSEDASDVDWLDPGMDTSASSLPSVGQASACQSERSSD